MAELDIVKGFTYVCQRINSVCVKNTLELKPRLVAVSKTKPKDMIISVYGCGQRHFGENYIQELVEKSNDSEELKPRLVAVSKTKPKDMIISVYGCGQRHFGENYIQELVEKSNDSEELKPRLVAVSKTKPKDMIISVYGCGQRHFGENYIQELVEKSNDSEILEKCKEIKWHFIGNLQRNKVNKIVSVPCLFVVETIDSEKLATALNNAWEKLNKPEPLNIMAQVNTSAEAEKGGVEPENCCTLANHIVQNCPHLNLIGLMTIGKFGYDLSLGPNPDFLCLRKCREDVCNKFNWPLDKLELSMGMSNDYEQAIELGSTSIRVGTSIFGYRTKKEGINIITQQIENITVH